MLHTEPSFCIYNTRDGKEEIIVGNEDLEGNELVEKDGVTSLGSRKFSFGKSAMALIDEDGNDEEGKEDTLREFEDLGIEDDAVSSLPLDAELGRGDGGLDSGPLGFDLNDNIEEYYEKMVRKDPSNPLFLRNYAQLLQMKGDFSGAEEYYFRAALADPKDGEILLQYAKLVWANHHDKDKASKYFKMATHAAPENSHALAGYASFLWDIDEDEEESSSLDEDRQDKEFGCPVDHCNTVFVEEKRPASPPLHLATGLGFNSVGFDGMACFADCATADYGDSTDEEDHYKRMIKENPSNPLILKNYARFLCETGGDLQAAEAYYSRVIQVDPTDGEAIIEYAQLIWQLHCDRRKALPYFKQAVDAAPGNSNVLAAYARFLWETKEDEDEEEEDITGRDNKSDVPTLQGTAATANA